MVPDRCFISLELFSALFHCWLISSYSGVGTYRVIDMNQDANAYFKEEYGVSLADEVVNHKINYCNSFQGGREISLEERNGFIDKMFQMDSEFLFEDLINEDLINISLTNWFIYTRYSEEDASEERIKRLINSKN